MGTEPSDKDEESRARSICEQCWLGPLCLAFWVIVIIGVFKGCANGAECKIGWQANPPLEMISSYRVYLGLELLAETTDTSAVIQLPDKPCEIAVVAVSFAGQSTPSVVKVSLTTDQQSADMRAWDTMHRYHREFLPGRRFYRTKIETPP